MGIKPFAFWAFVDGGVPGGLERAGVVAGGEVEESVGAEFKGAAFVTGLFFGVVGDFEESFR